METFDAYLRLIPFFFNRRRAAASRARIKNKDPSKLKSAIVIPETHITRGTRRGWQWKKGNRTENPWPSASVHGRPLTTSHFAFSANGWQRKYRSAWTGEQSDLRFVDECSCFSNTLQMCSAFLVNFVLFLRLSDRAFLHRSRINNKLSPS